MSFKDDLRLMPVFYGPTVLADTMAIDNRGLFEILDDDEYCELLRFLAQSRLLQVWTRIEVTSFAEILQTWLESDPPTLLSSLSAPLAAEVQRQVPRKRTKRTKLERFYAIAKQEIDFADRIRALDEIFLPTNLSGWPLRPEDFGSRLFKALTHRWTNEWAYRLGDLRTPMLIRHLLHQYSQSIDRGDRLPWTRTKCYYYLSEFLQEPYSRERRTASHDLVDAVYIENFTDACELCPISKTATLRFGKAEKSGLGQSFFKPKTIMDFLDWRASKPVAIVTSKREKHPDLERVGHEIIEFAREHDLLRDKEDTSIIDSVGERSALLGTALGSALAYAIGGMALTFPGGVFGHQLGDKAGRQIARVLRNWPPTRGWFYTRQQKNFLIAIMDADDSLEP